MNDSLEKALERIEQFFKKNGRHLKTVGVLEDGDFISFAFFLDNVTITLPLNSLEELEKLKFMLEMPRLPSAFEILFLEVKVAKL